MPECGIKFVSRDQLLSYEEMLKLCAILAKEGVSKVRITGGEPFVRKDLLPFIKRLSGIEGIEKIAITSNGSLLEPHIDQLVESGVTSINLSLDALDRELFKEITRRDDLPKVLESMHALIAAGMELKINMVVMGSHNTSQIIPMAELAKKHDIQVRFLEEMPFNGTGVMQGETWSYSDIRKALETEYNDLQPIHADASSTSENFKVPSHVGGLGIIPAMSRTFCGGCNRLRITPQGQMRTCLFGGSDLDLRQMIRDQRSDDDIIKAVREAVSKKAKDGFIAERNRDSGSVTESMATIGG
jgi:cyclic pyranopterin phosphate synthase